MPVGAAIRNSPIATRPAMRTCPRSYGWPSPRRSARRRPSPILGREEGRGFFQERDFLAELPVLSLELEFPLAFVSRRLGCIPSVPALVRRHPVSQRCVVDPEFFRHMRDWAGPIQHHADRFVLELLGERPTASQLPFPSE